MILIGLSWIVFWLMADVLKVELLLAALITGIVFVVLGILFEGAPSFRRPA